MANSKILNVFEKIFGDKNTPFKKRIFTAAIVNLAFVFSIFVFIPYETYYGNIDEFTFTFSQFWWPVALAGLLLFAVMTVVELLFKGKPFNIILSGVFGVTLASYAQGMFLNGMMKTLDGSEDAWTLSQKLINIAIWGIIVLIPVILAIFSKSLWKTVSSFGSFLIIGMQVVALISVMLTTPQKTFDYRMTDDGLYEVAEKNNVIVFILDRLDQTRIDDIVKDDPAFFNKFDGFTYYNNTTGSYTFTHNTVPFITTGLEMEDFYPTDEDKITAIKNSEYLKFIKEKAGNIGIYTDENIFPTNTAGEMELVDNIHPLPVNIDKFSIYKTSVKSALYRISPFAFKNRFEYTAYDFNCAVTTDASFNIHTVSNHSYDAAFMEKLKKDGLKINASYEKGCFRFIHLTGAHYPYQLNEDGSFAAEETDSITTCKGTLNILYKYLDELKKLGVYDDASIIVTTDHGDTLIANNEESFTLEALPIMFYKPANSKLEAGPAITSAPASHMDIFPTVIEAFGGNLEDFDKDSLSFEGIPLDKLTEETTRVRYVYYGLQDPKITDKQSCINVEFEIKGDAKNPDNWSQTGKRIYTKNNNHGF